MGQRTDRFAAVPRSKHTANSLLRYSAFTTPLGWMAFAGRDEAVFRLVIGHATEAAARSQIEQMMAADGEEACPDPNWLPSVRRLLEQFSLGVAVDFSDVTVQMPAHLTEFQRRVLQETRKIAFGDTVTYAELAARAGRPGAARAVGNVMAMNRVPIIIPCHRVVAAGKLGGYSAPRGVELKKQILRLEADGIEPVPALALN